MKKYFNNPATQMLMIFIMTMLILTFARHLANDSWLIYTVIGGGWFILLFSLDILNEKSFLKDQWLNFKQQKWKNIGLIILTLVLVVITIQTTRPFFNRFIPVNDITGYAESPNTLSGILFNIVDGILALIVAFVEEIAYRYKGIYSYKKNKIMMGTMLIVSNVLFGFSHYYSFGGSFLATSPYIIAGFIMSITYLISRNIWVPLWSHLIFNSMALISSILLLIFYPLI